MRTFIAYLFGGTSILLGCFNKVAYTIIFIYVLWMILAWVF